MSATALLTVGALSSCGSDDTDASDSSDVSAVPPAQAPTAATVGTDTASTVSDSDAVDVKALDNTFIEDQVEVAVGTEVVWTNGGRNDHDIVPVVEDAGWGVGIEDFHPGDSYAYRFTEPGEYAYYCTIHGTAEVGMTGTVVVR